MKAQPRWNDRPHSLEVKTAPLGVVLFRGRRA